MLDRISAQQLEHTQIETPFQKRNFGVAMFVMALVFGIFAARAVFLQVGKGEVYGALAEANKSRNYPLLAGRGIIYDRYMTPLVENVPSFDVVAVPADMPKEKGPRERMAKELENLLGVETGSLISQFGRYNLADINPVVVKENVPRELALFLETRLADFSGIELKKNAVRQYPDGKLFSQVVGYVGRTSKDDLAKNPALSTIDYIGKSGVEFSYDSLVRGTNGILKREVDAAARLKKEKQIREDAAGQNAMLTVDALLQKKITEVLSRSLTNTPTATGVAAVALDPYTGEILALVSMPSYDNNMFSDPSLQGEYEKEEQNRAQPFFNRAVSGLYPPGSSIKPFLALAALEEKVVTPETRIMSTGAIVIHSPYDPNVTSVFRDWKEGGHGLVNVTRAIAESVNTYFFTIGGGYGGIDGLGIDRIKEYLNAFGFGAKTEVDLPAESAGTVPDKKWKEDTLKERWTLGDTYNTSIGQGNLLVSPLQLAQGYAMIANGGKLIRPFLVKKVFNKDKKTVFEHTSETVRDHVVSDTYLEVVRRALRETVTNGTARRLVDLPVAVAGKTGTAQFGTGKAHAWFASFAPYDNPQMALVILVENGGEGSAVAVPAAHEIYEWYFSRK